MVKKFISMLEEYYFKPTLRNSFRWVSDNGQTGSVLTIAELIEEGENQTWKGISEEVVLKSLKALENDKKCEVFEGNDGVKFF